jgi:hypothetical protein
MVFPPEDFNHPEKNYKGLVYVAEGDDTPPEFEEERRGLDIGVAGPAFKDHELCWWCGWTVMDQVSSTYMPRVRFLRHRDNSGMWALGSKLFLKDIPNDGNSPGSDFVTQQFLRNQPGLTIPLISRMELLNEPADRTYLLLMSRAKGQPLDTIWFSLSEEKRNSLREQLLIYLREIRQFTALTPQTIDGRLLDDNIIADCSMPRPACKQIGSTTEKWFENIAEELRVGLSKVHNTKDAVVIEKEFQKLKDNFPDPEPYVLGHGDLTFGNIMVDPEDNKLTAIIDWEHPGYYPWWAERWMHSNTAYDGSHELLNSVWERLSPDFESERYMVLVTDKLSPVLRAYERCRINHPNARDYWYRPAFSKTEPWAGKFDTISMGGDQKREHVIMADQGQ